MSLKMKTTIKILKINYVTNKLDGENDILAKGGWKV